MTKKEYIEKAKQTILNRVKFHAPIMYDSEIDRTKLFESGIDISKPLFKFERPLNKLLLKAFEEAQKESEFNLVMPLSVLGRKRESFARKLRNCVFYSDDSSASFLESINKLNINYATSSSYDLKYKDKFFEFNGEVLNPNYDNFCLKQIGCFGDVFVQYREFVLNGNNVWVKLFNNSKKMQKIDSEINIPLQKGYYFFKKQRGYIQIENVLNGQKRFLNYVCKNAVFSFSNVNGLSNSLFCCINVKFSFFLKPGEHKNIFFNFGEQRFFKRGKFDIFEDLFDLSRKLCCQIFNLRIKTKNPKFDFYFNKILPQKIWTNWINEKFDKVAEEKYLTLKRLFLRGKDKILFVPFREIGVRELGVFNGLYYKKILVVPSSTSFVKIGKVTYNSLVGFSKKTLQNPDPISLSFG